MLKKQSAQKINKIKQTSILSSKDKCKDYILNLHEVNCYHTQNNLFLLNVLREHFAISANCFSLLIVILGK